jgi:hypothetical protein
MIGTEPDRRSPRHSVHPVRLIIRESTAPPPRDGRTPPGALHEAG